MDTIVKLGKIDRRVLYILMVVLLLWPLIKPLGLPVSVSSWTRQTYDRIEALKAGDRVIIDFDYPAGGMADVHPQTLAVFNHLMKRNIRVICIAFVDQGASIADGIIRSWEAQGKKYGEDFVHLGYLAGGETAMSAFANNIPKAVPTDFRGKPASSLPIMDGLKTAGDAQMLMYFTTALLPETWIRQTSQWKLPIIGGVITVMGPQGEPFLQSGQLAGLLVGMRCGAEYEVISKAPGPAVAAMDAQSIGHLLIIVFIIFGNIAYFAERQSRKRSGL